MELPFTKVQALGNHFALVWAPEIGPQDWHDLVPRLCRHHFGIGADGFLAASPSDRADVRMVYRDPDGTEAMCGNGLRCVALWAYRRGLASTSVTVETIAGIRRCDVLPDGRIRAEMGEPILETSKLPALAAVPRLFDYPLAVGDQVYDITGVSLGTPHAVIIGREHGGPEWVADSAAIENHPMFPDQATVDWVEVVSRDTILMRPWEARVGETLACGTGACASVVATALHGLTERHVRVEMKGGSIDVEWREDNQVLATGEAAIVYHGVFYDER